jgi:hypothetical protein
MEALHAEIWIELIVTAFGHTTNEGLFSATMGWACIRLI